MSVNPAITNSLGETRTYADLFSQLYFQGTNVSGKTSKEAVIASSTFLADFYRTSVGFAINGDPLGPFLSSFNSSNPMPTNATAFLVAYNNYLLGSTYVAQADSTGGFLSRLANDLNSFTSITANNTTLGRDPSIAQAPLVTTSQAAEWLSGFLRYYQQVYVQGNQSNVANFQSLLGNLMGVASVVQTTSGNIGSGTWIYTTNAAGGFDSNINVVVLNSYYALYKAANPNATNAEFNTAFNAFVSDETVNHGIFIPSEAFNDWVTKVMSAASVTDYTSLWSIGAKKTVVLNSIFALIGLLLGSIQEVAAAQSARLVLLTNWQQSYSNLLSQIPTFLQSNFPTLGAIRSELNSTFNNKLTQNLQTLQSLVSDTAKGMQSNINQANDAVSQQANMGTSLIQELNAILSAIFR